MNTNRIATLGTSPPILFGSDEMSETGFFYTFKIVNHAHAIRGSIALVQVRQTSTGKTGTTKAVPDSTLHYLLAVLNATRNTVFRFMVVIHSATRTWFNVFLVSSISTTEITVHTTGGN